jgi:hypothetical protein
MMDVITDHIRVCEDGSGFFTSQRLIADHYEDTSDYHLWWFIETFITDRSHKLRLKAMLHEVDTWAWDMARVAKAEGRHVQPRQMASELKRRLLRGYFPTVDEIVAEARAGQPLRIQEALFRAIPEESWRKRS